MKAQQRRRGTKYKQNDPEIGVAAPSDPQHQRGGGHHRRRCQSHARLPEPRSEIIRQQTAEHTRRKVQELRDRLPGYQRHPKGIEDRPVEWQVTPHVLPHLNDRTADGELSGDRQMGRQGVVADLRGDGPHQADQHQHDPTPPPLNPHRLLLRRRLGAAACCQSPQPHARQDGPHGADRHGHGPRQCPRCAGHDRQDDQHGQPNRHRQRYALPAPLALVESCPAGRRRPVPIGRGQQEERRCGCTRHTGRRHKVGRRCAAQREQNQQYDATTAVPFQVCQQGTWHTDNQRGREQCQPQELWN